MASRFQPDVDPDEISTAIQQNGYAIVEGLIGQSELNELSAQLNPHIDAAGVGDSSFLGDKTKRLVGLLSKSSAAQQLAMHPMIMAVADRVLLPYCARYQINYSGVMHLQPGQLAQPLHRDGRCYPFANPAPPTTLATMWSVDEFRTSNGATRLIPGSHLWDDARKHSEEESIFAEMPRGSVVLYTGGVLHGAGANQSARSRTGVAIHYSLGWLRQVENQYLAVDRDIAKKLPEALQRLMGYDLGGPFLGMVGGGDPHQVLANQSGEAARQRTSDELEAAHTSIRKLKVEPHS
jgi:ectoine hydroxylase-related dioxygenase (phytanoyl-CoA dioxygenase family)